MSERGGWATPMKFWMEWVDFQMIHCAGDYGPSGVPTLFAFLCHTRRRRVVLGHMLNTLWHIITKKKISYKVLSKFTILCWIAFTAILGCTWPAGCRLDTPERFCTPLLLPISQMKSVVGFYLWAVVDLSLHAQDSNGHTSSSVRGEFSGCRH